jgi:hypothetical protein
VVHRVPQQVNQRIPDLVQDRAIHLDLFPFDLERDPLAQLPRKVSHHPGKRSNTCHTGVILACTISPCISEVTRRCARRPP